MSLQRRLNERDCVSNHRRLHYLLDRLFRRISKKASKLRVTGLCEGTPPAISGFPSQRASNAEMSPFDIIMTSRIHAYLIAIEWGSYHCNVYVGHSVYYRKYRVIIQSVHPILPTQMLTPDFSGRNGSLPWLLMPRYWPWIMFSTRKNFDHLRYLSVVKWCEIQVLFFPFHPNSSFWYGVIAFHFHNAWGGTLVLPLKHEVSNTTT